MVERKPQYHWTVKVAFPSAVLSSPATWTGNREREERRRDAIDATVFDDFAAKPDRVHNPSNLDCDISLWNVIPKREPSAAYSSPLPDPEPR